MKLTNINSSYIIYGLIFLCILFVIYLIVSSSNTQDYVYYSHQWNRDGSTNLWYGLNAGGDYRGYGREYGGHLSPRRIYGKTHTPPNHMEHHMDHHMEKHHSK